MSFGDFVRDIVPILQLCIASLGLVSVILLWRQIKDAKHWNQINATFALVAHDRFVPFQREMYDAFGEEGISLLHVRQLGEAELAAIARNDRLQRAVINYLNYVDSFCAGVNYGALENDLAYALFSEHILDAWYTFQPYIKMQQDHTPVDIFLEAEKLAGSWDAINEKKLKEKKQRRLNDGLRKRID
jgi:hypothetical protein